MVKLVFKAEEPQHLATAWRIFAAVAMNPLRQTEISFSRESGKEIKSLENKANLATPDRGTLGIGGCGDIFIVDDYPTTCWRQQPSQKVKHR
jgi:hypothetical protein